MTTAELKTAAENLAHTVECKNGKWDASMLADVLKQCAHLSEAEFYSALQRCKAELSFPIIPVDITDRCPSLAVQSADEAWVTIGSSSERETVVCTDLTLAAWGEVAGEPDPTARRMAFRRAYERLASAYKTAGRRPVVSASLGTDPHGRAEPLKRAVASGLLPVTEARRLLGLPQAADGSQKLLPAPPMPISQGVALSEEDSQYIRSWWQSPKTTPTEVEIRHRLGPHAAEKLRLFLSAGQSVKTYAASGCQSCGQDVAEDTTHCAVCAPTHKDRALDRQRRADDQNQRERNALDKMRGAR